MTSPDEPTAATGALGRYLEAVLDGDRRRAFDVIDDACTHGASLAELYLEVFQPALREIGARWESDSITVADEHLATAITQAAMARTFERLFVWGAERRRTLVAACADSERHEVGLRMVCDLLELEGWETTWLGAAVPTDSLVSMVARKRPDVVAISVAIREHLPRVEEMVAGIREELGDDAPHILVGGRPFLDDPALAEAVGANFTAPDAVRTVELLDRVVPG